MPITIRTHPLKGEPWPEGVSNDPSHLLYMAAETESEFVKTPLSNSFKFSPNTKITPTPNGLVDAAITAWNTHHHLILRPDDIWIAILSQLGFYIDAHAEELRDFFVAHEGQKYLEVVQYDVTPRTCEYSLFARQMSDKMVENVKDPSLVTWIIPDFSTTTEDDKAVASVLLMGAMKKYFDYGFCCVSCGIPSVTLLGERADWVELQNRIERIPELKGEAVEFHRLLKPIARHMVLSFDEPGSPAVLEFWRGIACWEIPSYQFSGPTEEDKITGWITAFCFWDDKGARNKYKIQGDRHCIDGVAYGSLDESAKTAGWAAVLVKVIHKHYDGTILQELQCRMVAGSVGIRPGKHEEMGVMLDGPEPAPAEWGAPFRLPLENKSGDDEVKSDDDRKPKSAWQQVSARHRRIHPDAPPASECLDAVQPLMGWWIYEGEEISEQDSWERRFGKIEESGSDRGD